MSFAGLSGFDGSGAPPYGHGAPAQGSLGAPGDPGAAGATSDVRGVADFFEDYFGGGGFLQTGNFLTQAQQPTGPQLSLIPVKIAHVYKAWMQDPSSLQVSFFPSGPLLHLVKLVGVVDVLPRETLEAALQSARIQFALDDFTGRIECEYTVGDELTEYRQNQILVPGNALGCYGVAYCQNDTALVVGVQDALCCGGLVTIFGSINLLGKSEPSLRVHAIRQTQTAADLIYHESACQAAYLRLKYPNEDIEGGASAGQQHSLQQQQQAPFGVPQRVQGSAQPAFQFG
ncbi:replication protein A2, putative [Eimeria praecox]|uniref:Replication protein A2, putative n=1 Tax=Eimeria praecox TaxID=51316 RepID=U6G577_9EIME|nr:replication protein A2, putative [Eimeria praecox]